MLLVKKVKAGALIFKEGDFDKAMYIVIEGRVQLYSTRNNRDADLAIIQKHNFFGDIEMFGKKPRCMSAKAITDCKLAVFKNRIQLEQFIAQNPSFTGRTLRMMGERLATTTNLL